MKYVKAFSIVPAAWIVAYLVGSLGSADFNPANWNEYARWAVALVGTFIGAALTVAFTEFAA